MITPNQNPNTPPSRLNLSHDTKHSIACKRYQSSNFASRAHMDNSRKKGKLHPSSDSSPGAYAIQKPRRPHGRSSSLRPSDALSSQKAFTRDEQECQKQVIAPAADRGGNICSYSQVVEKRPGTVEHGHAVEDEEVMTTLREKGRMLPSSNTSPGAFHFQESSASHGSARLRAPAAMLSEPFIRNEEECKRALMAPAAHTEDICSDSRIAKNGPDTEEKHAVQGQQVSRSLRNKGKLPPSSDSSPGAFEVQKPPRPHGCSRSLRPSDALSPQKAFTRDEQERTKQVLTPTADTEGNICSYSQVVEKSPGTVEDTHAVEDEEVTRTLREKGRRPPSSDYSPGAFQGQGSSASHCSARLRPPATMLSESFIRSEEECKKEIMTPTAHKESGIFSSCHIVNNGPDTKEKHAAQGHQVSRSLRNKGKLPPSSDSSPGAYAIQKPQRPHVCPRSVRPLHALSSQEAIRFDEEECREEMGEPVAETECNIGSDNTVVDDTPDTVEAYAVNQNQEGLGEPIYADIVTEDPRKWRERPLCRAIFVGNCLFFVGVVVLVMYLTKVIGGTPPTTLPPQTSTPTWPPLTPGEEIACNFIGHPSSSDCRTTYSFDGVNGDEVNGTTIPSEIGLLIQLTTLNFFTSKLNGSIPSSISYLTKLESLMFDQNKLTGSIPPSLSSLTLLTRLQFNGNVLTGSIPSSLSNLTRLTTLSLWKNRLLGSIPPWISNLTQLASLSFTENAMTGSIPASISTLTLLTDLFFDDNQLKGSIPPSLASLTLLTKLRFNSNELTGSIPAWISTFTNLEELNFAKNNLTGSIPRSLSNLTKLENLWFDSNRLTGSIPPSLSDLSLLTLLSFDDNELKGSIPPSFSDLAKLTWLSFDINQLDGSIPPSLSTLTQLNSLSFSENELTGSIPPSFSSLTNLTNLWFDDNQLTGSIPPSLSSLTLLTSLLFNSNKLTGSIPSSLSNLTKLIELWFDNNTLTGSFPSSLCTLSTDVSIYIDCDVTGCTCCKCP